ncbi:sulfatase/phosphatase domain-containing protein [Alteromonas sp. KUL49]|uniref:sulfatase/phosphatase domain-containing protein n=1 Tax=Alteromonas sp. KUL49 TaxID=2480798 RepID=UPI0015E89D19|nr:sulfatase/phosphatase domain-containing protein [Alteromonas sp. KUL49]
MRTEKWKYVDFYKHDYEQLYDLENDPQEARNLANDPAYASIVNELSQKVDEYIAYYEAARSEEVAERNTFINVRRD